MKWQCGNDKKSPGATSRASWELKYDRESYWAAVASTVTVTEVVTSA
jgi:hypothetical protein